MNTLRSLLLTILFISATPATALSLNIKPIYPEFAAENCIEGDVAVEYTFNSEGKPTNILIIEANPPGVFEEATKKNMSLWFFPEKTGQTEQETLSYRLEGCDS